MNLLDVLQTKQNYTLIDIILVYCKEIKLNLKK